MLVFILTATAIYLLIGISFQINYSVTNFFDISYAISLVLPSYLIYLFSNELKWDIYLSISFSIFLMIIINLLLYALIYYKFLINKTKSLILLIISLGVYIVIQNLISLIWGDDILSIRTGKVTAGYNFLGSNVTTIQIVIISSGLLIFLSLLAVLKFSNLGLKIRAVSLNSALSTIFGVESRKVIFNSIILSTLIASITGLLYAFNYDITPTMGFNLLLYGIIAMIIGGGGSTWGLLGGALLLAIAQNLGAYYINSKWMDAIAYFILILFLIWKPLGFSGKRLKKIEI